MKEELIYRRDCNLFAESLDYEGMIHDTMAEYGFTWLNCKGEQDDPDRIFDFARTILQRAQNVIDTADTVGYEKERIEPGEGDTVFTYIRYLTYEENDNEN